MEKLNKIKIESSSSEEDKKISRRSALKVIAGSVTAAAIDPASVTGAENVSSQIEAEKRAEEIKKVTEEVNKEFPSKEDYSDISHADVEKYISPSMIYEKTQKVSSLVHSELTSEVQSSEEQGGVSRYFKENGYFYNESRDYAGGDVFIPIEKIENFRLKEVGAFREFFPEDVIDIEEDVIFISDEKFLNVGQRNRVNDVVVNLARMESVLEHVKSMVPKNEAWADFSMQDIEAIVFSNELIGSILNKYHLYQKLEYDCLDSEFGKLEVEDIPQLTEFISDVMSINASKFGGIAVMLNTLRGDTYRYYAPSNNLMAKILGKIAQEKGIETTIPIGEGRLDEAEIQNILENLDDSDFKKIQEEFSGIGRQMIADAKLLDDKE